MCPVFCGRGNSQCTGSFLMALWHGLLRGLTGPRPGLAPAWLHTSAAWMSLPSKKKRRMDPMVDKMREDKRRGRLAKALKKMQRKDRIPRPIVELEIQPHIVQELSTRHRSLTVTDEVREERILLGKEWTRFAGRRFLKEIKQYDSVIISQQKALEELRGLSLNLYFEAIQSDLGLLPFRVKGPVYTSRLEDYIQDGEYKDTSKQFVVKYGDMKQFMGQLLDRPRKKKKKPEDDI
eukprot:maker-scaffold50_size457468-snap-gene-1.17 protein:Tk03207 transcript:maker-scaffold50_size457468-snap-gene-1.17-mRNA-1 annotation:"39s ribosomal protein mitochondrial"